MSQKAVTDFVEEHVASYVEENVSDIPIIKTRNIADLTFESGYIHTEGFEALPGGIGNTAAQQYIEVQSGTQYTASWADMGFESGPQLQIFYYTAEKTYINTLYHEMNTGACIFKTPNTCKYIRICISQKSTSWQELVPNKFQIELGNVATDYIAPEVIDPAYIDYDYAGATKIVQTTGDSQTDVMSQNATTELAEKITQHVVAEYSPSIEGSCPFLGNINSSGNFGESGSWLATDYILVNKNTTIKSTSMYGVPTLPTVAFYDAYKKFVSGIFFETSGYFTIDTIVPENIKYARFTFLKSNNNGVIQLEKWGEAISSEDIVQTRGDEFNKVMSQKAVTEFVEGHIPLVTTRNLANLTFENAYVASGVLTPLQTGTTDAAAPEYIEVNSDSTYAISWEAVKESPYPQMQVHLYDSNKVYLSTQYADLLSGTTSYMVKTPTNCKYIRISFARTGIEWRKAVPNKFQIELGNVATDYIAPEVIDPAYIDYSKAALNYTRYGLPILEFSGNTIGMNKDNAVTLSYKYGERTGSCTLKWQGSSSVQYPKKNYTVKFDTAFEAKEGWGEQKKYCLKANYIDFSHSRNICSAKLWGTVVKSREVLDERLRALVNAGAIDGFPICVVINGEYKGLYTFNIPKDGWMFGMGDEDATEHMAILCASNCSLRSLVALTEDDLEIEYATDEDNTAWINTSVNRLIQACIDSDGTDLDTTIAQYLDWDSAIDYYAFCLLTQNLDGVTRNYLLVTYDGTKWFFSAYDLDSTFGLYVNGKKIMPNDGSGNGYGPCSVHGLQDNLVFELIKKYKPKELKARYKDLTEGYNGAWGKPLSEDRVYDTVVNFAGSIPKALLDEEVKIWPTLPSTSVNSVYQMVDYYRRRRAYIDPQIEEL